MVAEPDEDQVEVKEMTREEGRAFFDCEARERLGMSGDEFLRRWDAGELDWDDAPGISSVAMLIPFAR